MQTGKRGDRKQGGSGLRAEVLRISSTQRAAGKKLKSL